MSVGVVGDYFDQIAGGWDERCEPSGAKHLAIAQLAGVREGSRVLDVGCGTGIMEPAYLQLGAARILALDMSQGMIDCAREKFAAVPTDILEFDCADVLALEAAGQFDSIVIYNAYPHILDRDALVSQVHKLLAPQGRFLVAHGMSREALGKHHANVPETVSRELLSAREEAAFWEGCFAIDEMADTPFIYFFGGSIKS